MYEDNEQPVLRRALLAIVWLVIIVTIAWASIWLAFFRHDNSQTNQGGLKHATTQHPQSPVTNNKKQGSSGSNTGSTSQGSNSNPNTGNTSSQQPQTLANTGAGNVFVPFTVATIVGTTVYYIRLRKKLMQ